MIVPVIMPRQGQSVESCVITNWYKSKGDSVSEGDVLFSYETDKASFEEESGVSGILVDIFYNEGEEVPVLSNVCSISVEGGAQQAFNVHNETINVKEDPKIDLSENNAPYAGNLESDERKSKLSDDQNENVKLNNVRDNVEDKLKISPRAKNLADRLGVDPAAAGASGPEGRIIEKDIANAYDKGTVFTRAAKDEGLSLAGSEIEGSGIGGRITTEDLKSVVLKRELPLSESPDYEERKLTNIRKVIANAMQTSLSTIPQLTLNSSFDATDILALRKKLKNYINNTDLNNVTINDMILFAVSRTIIDHKDLNAHLVGNTMNLYKHVHLGIAVDTEKGLMVPTIFNADLLSLVEISKTAKDLAQKCIDGTIKPDLLKGASFTITNLGVLQIESFTPVINPPQTGILGIGSLVQRCKEDNGGNITCYPSIGLSLTFDHRALDGAPAARFLQHLKTNLENFSVLLVK